MNGTTALPADNDGSLSRQAQAGRLESRTPTGVSAVGDGSEIALTA